MQIKLTSGGDATDDVSSPYGTAHHETGEPVKEKRLYGEPCHEVGESIDEEQLYGDPQHDAVEPEEARDSLQVSTVFVGEPARLTRPADRSASWSERPVSKRR